MKLQPKHSHFLLEAIRFLFILLFVCAGLTKLLESPAFYNTLRNAPLFGGMVMAEVFSRAIPLVELIVALLLTLRRTLVAGLYGAVVVLGIISSYTGALVFFAPYTPCSCGGVTAILSPEQHLLLSGCALLLAAWALWYMRNQERKKKQGQRGR